jgi:polyisoprenoid-binding protein YceI
MSTIDATRTFVSDPVHSTFAFSVRFLGGSIYRARFERAEATLELSGETPTLGGSADVQSVSIHEPADFRNHVLGPDFFDAATHPVIAFRSTTLRLNDDGAVHLEGELTVKGIAKTIAASGTWTSPSTGPMGDRRSAMSLEATVNRRDFGMTWDAPLPDGGSALADDVTLTIDLALAGKE